MRTERLGYRLYGYEVLNWFTDKRGPEKVLASVTLTVEQTWDETAQEARWHRIGGPREFTWKARKTTRVTHCTMDSPRDVRRIGKRDIRMPMWEATIDPGNTVTITVPEKVAKLS